MSGIKYIPKFSNFSYAKYATDVTSHQRNSPTGNLQEGKKNFCGKHIIYWYKVEVSVIPFGIAIGFTVHYLGSISEIDIFHQNRRLHRVCLENRNE